jgi:hypothetical protein
MASQHLSMQFPVRGRRSRASGRGAPVGTLPGPSRTITVEPIQVPVIAPSPPQPAEPAREPPAREPAKEPRPAREPAPSR